MREIKFRAWNKLTNKMIPVWGIGLNMDQDGEICIETPGRSYTDHESGERDCHIDVLRGHNFELMQFTGLKDKNGVEIWEGDVVECEHDHRIGVYYDDHYEGGGRFRLWPCEICRDKKRTSKLEVIGNIHENRELLNGA